MSGSNRCESRSATIAPPALDANRQPEGCFLESIHAPTVVSAAARSHDQPVIGSPPRHVGLPCVTGGDPDMRGLGTDVIASAPGRRTDEHLELLGGVIEWLSAALGTAHRHGPFQSRDDKRRQPHRLIGYGTVFS